MNDLAAKRSNGSFDSANLSYRRNGFQVGYNLNYSRSCFLVGAGAGRFDLPSMMLQAMS
jgi:hypothetical protein